MGHVRGGAGAGGVAEVAPAIGVERGKAALIAQDVLEGGERRGRPFLRPEAGIENPAVGVVERDHEVLRQEPGEPRMRRGVEMHEHADERPALALTPVLPPRWRLRDQPRLLEDEARPRVREAKAVVLDRVLVEVLDGEALVVPRVEAAEPGDRLEPNAPAARQRPAVIADAVPALLLEAPFDPAHVSGREARDVGGLIALVVGLVRVVQAARGRAFGLGGVVTLIAGMAFLAIAVRGRGAPRINDFTTDLGDPPAFRNAVTLPANAGRDLVYPPAFA